MRRDIFAAGFATCAAIVCAATACGGGGGDGGPADALGEHGGEVQGEVPGEGDPCDDGDPCTFGDTVRGGACSGTAYECPKGKSPYCVASACDGRGGCEPDVDPGFCFMDGACFADGARNPDDDCGRCDAGANPLDWSPASGVTGCSDGNPCTTDDHCEAGKCVGIAADCDDKNPCTTDSCDATGGCKHAEAQGTCDDLDPCTVGDTCEGGLCRPGASPLDCDDGNPCTVDTCISGSGCKNELLPAVACDDHNDCTTDACVPSTGCSHAPVVGPCDDHDACTVGDECEGTTCQPGPEALDCDDDSACTADSCDPVAGCIHAHLSGPCDDGEVCTENDTCLVGKCSGKKTIDCGLCAYEPNDEAHKVVSLSLGTGHAGGGMDLDDDPGTCAPATSCSNGIDNELGQLGVFVNPGIKDSLAQGTVLYVFEMIGMTTGAPFTLNLVDTGLVEEIPTCDFQEEECDYYPAQDSMDTQCRPIIHFDNATVVGTVLRAGGKGYSFPLQANLIGGQPLVLGIASARVQANLIWEEDKVVAMEGFLGGGVAKEQLMDTLSKLPAWVFPMDKDQVLEMLDALIKNDLDTDGNGEPDAASINLKFSTIPANLVSPPLPR